MVKSKIRISKSETNPDDQNSNVQNKLCFFVLVIGILNLSFDSAQDGEHVEPFRISRFGFSRIKSNLTNGV